MNNQEFLSESLDFIRREYGEFVELQEQIREILEVFHGICKRNHLPYFLAYGSLLGQLRDGGSIPWDPDMDVCMPLPEVPRLMEALDRELPEGYFYKSNFNTPGYLYFEMRIGKKEFPIDMVHLDVFYLIGGPEGQGVMPFRREIQKLFMMRVGRALVKKTFDPLDRESKAAFYLKKVRDLCRCRFMSMAAIDRKFRKLAEKYDYNSSALIYSFNEIAEEYPRDQIEPMKTEILNGREIGLPNDPAACLERCYKNWREYLPVENRFHEFYDWKLQYRRACGKLKIIRYAKD